MVETSAADPALGVSKGGESAVKTFTLEDIQKHVTEEDCWIVVDGKVYDVTKFLDEHPGGYDIVVSNTGKDATEEFEEIGHSNSAREMLDKYEIGRFEGGAPVAAKPVKPVTVTQEAPGFLVTTIRALAPPVLILLLALLYYNFSS